MNDLKEKTEAWNGIATLTYKVAIALGAIVTLIYMFRISYFPTGLTPGEVIFFVFIALAFGFVSAILLVYGTFSALWLSQFLTHGTRLFVFRNWKPRSSKAGWLHKLKELFQEKEYLRSSAVVSRLIKFRLGATRAAKKDVRLLPKEADHFLLRPKFHLCFSSIFLSGLHADIQQRHRADAGGFLDCGVLLVVSERGFKKIDYRKYTSRSMVGQIFGAVCSLFSFW